jgi:hypothetical protein
MEIVGRLNGINTRIGNLMGLDYAEGRFTVVVDGGIGVCVLCYATPEDLDAVRYREPQTVAEHHATPRTISPFGMVRCFKPKPAPPKDLKLTFAAKNQLRKQLEETVVRNLPNRKIRRMNS